MFKNKLTKTTILLVALLMLATVLFAACSDAAFVPNVTLPESGAVNGNGGIAVQYGNYIYYVNGYESNVNATNTYTNGDARIGSVVRLSVTDLETILAINDESNMTSSEKTEAITEKVRELAKVVVPNVYYSANSTTTALNGLYIFGDRIYITTPNHALTAAGEKRSSESILASYKLDGSDRKDHYVFTSNAAQIILDEVDNKVVATYIMNVTNSEGSSVATVNTLDVATGTNTVVAEKVTSTFVDYATNSIYYINNDKEIACVALGATEETVVVENAIPEGKEETTVTYTIKSVNDGTVYYTKADSAAGGETSVILYYANSTVSGEMALGTVPSVTFFGYNNGVVYTKSETYNDKTIYNIYKTNGTADTITEVLPKYTNDTSITINKIVGDVLHYTVNSISYTVDLSVADPTPVAYAYSISTSATGWSTPDVLNMSGYNYIFTLSEGSITVIKFDIATKKNTPSAGTNITLTVAEEDTDEE